MRLIESYCIFLFLSASLGYFFGAAYARSLLLIFWAIFMPLFITAVHVSPPPAVLSTAALSLFLLAIIRAKEDNRRAGMRAALNERTLQDTHDTYQKELRRINLIDEQAKKKELSIFNLYEFMKRLSPNLKFEEIFLEFCNFLHERFSFTKSELIIAGAAAAGDNAERIRRIFSVDKQASGEYGAFSPVQNAEKREKPLVIHEKLFQLLSQKHEAVFMTARDHGSLFRTLDLGEDVETFVAVPLKSKNTIAAILTVENLNKTELEDFSILTMQFALALKKVLLYETVENMAITDGLTNIYSRRYFLERFEEEIRRSMRQHLEFSFLMADIDHFKQCNDLYGHLVGDVVLKEIAGLIKMTVREIDLVSRYGGEEFSVLLPETGKKSALHVAERIRSNVKEKVFKAYDETLRLSISIGVASYPVDAGRIKEMIEKADAALYKAKRNGRNRVCEYSR